MKLSDIPKWLPKLQELAEGMKAGRKIQFLDKPANEWRTISDSSVLVVTIESPDQYRVEPEPVKPREVWVLKHVATGSLRNFFFDSEDDAKTFLAQNALDFTNKPVKFVEVVDE